MSRGIVNKNTGEIIVTASGQRMWVGTKQAHANAVSAGTMPNNCIVAITDDYEDTSFKDYTSGLVAGTDVTIENNSFCFVSNHICHFTIYFHSSTNKAPYSTIIKSGMPQIIQNTGSSTYQYHFSIYKNAMNTAPVSSCYIAENTVGSLLVLALLSIETVTTSYVVQGTYMTNE